MAEIKTAYLLNGGAVDLIKLQIAANQQLIATTGIKPNFLKHG